MAKTCPRCLNNMRRFERSYWKGWNCQFCGLMVRDNGDISDSGGSVPQCEVDRWPVPEEYEEWVSRYRLED